MGSGRKKECLCTTWGIGGENHAYNGCPLHAPPAVEQTPHERIAQELKYKLRDAGKIEAFWSVDIQRNQSGEPVPTVTVIADNTGTEEQREAIRHHLWGIADIFREIYRVI